MNLFRQCRIGFTALFLLLLLVPAGAWAASQAAARHTFAGSVPREALAASDEGRVESALPMEDMLLLLEPDAAHTAALKQFLEDAQNPNSASYRKWVTPAEFGERFGVSESSVQTVSTWLAASGLHVTAVANGRNWIRFSGTASQVEAAFATEIHRYKLASVTHYANATELSIPQELAQMVGGVVSLNNFVKPAQHTRVGKVARDASGKLRRMAQTTIAGVSTDGGDARLLVQPDFTSQGSPEEIFLAPGDFATIYNTTPLVSAGTNGSGVSIALVGRSDISMSDVETFRTVFGLPFNDPTITYANSDPGVISGDDEEAVLDVEWSGAVAPEAKINLVIGATTTTTDGVDISASYIVDNALAPIMSVSFGECEQRIGPTETAFYDALWQQAAAEGITVFVSSGDAGSSACDIPNEYFATNYPMGVNGLASTPYNVAVGGTEFNDVNTNTYWNQTVSANLSSAIGYIPEAVWNESCNPNLPVSEDNCYFSPTDEGTYAGGGGASNCSTYDGSGPSLLTGLYDCVSGYAKPSWQSGNGVPADGARDLPDLSLAAAALHDGFLLCYDGSCQYTVNASGAITLDSATIIGGTSAASPSMAGIMALVEQKNGAFQGQANYRFYALAAQQASSLNCDSSAATDPTQTNACVYHDVTLGSNALSCLSRESFCTAPVSGSSTFALLPGESATAGYDLASGLGSVNAANLVSAWSNLTLTATNTSLGALSKSFVHGTGVRIISNVTPESGAGTPTGSLLLESESKGVSTPILAATLNNGRYEATVSTLPGGSYSLTAHYAGDSTYSASTSAPLALTVTPEASTATATAWAPSRFSILGRHPIVEVTGVELGTNFYLQVQLAGASGKGIPTGTVTLFNGTTAIGTYPVNNTGEIYIPCGPYTACDYAPGVYNFTASYSGDASFNPTTTVFAPFTISQGPLNYEAFLSNQTPPAGSTVICTVYFGYDPAVLPTGTVTLNRSDTGAVLATGTINSSGDAVIPFVAAAGTYWVTATYSGDANYSNGILEEYEQLITATAGATASKVTLVSAASKASLGQRTAFTITVTPSAAKSGAPTPTGTVTFYSPAGQATNPIQLTGGAVTTFYEWDSAGTQQLNAVYSGDANYAGSTSSFATVAVAQGNPTLTLSALASYVAVGGQSSVTGTLTSTIASTGAVAPTGSVQFYDSVGGAAAVAIGTAQALNTGNGSSILATLAPYLSTGVNTVTAVYSGDSNWASVPSNAVTITVTTPGFVATETPNPLVLTAGSSAAVTVATQSILGYSGTVAVSCGGTLPVGVSCSPASIAAGGTGSITLTSIAPGTSTGTSASARGFWGASGLVSAACLLFLCLPRRMRRIGLPVFLLIAGLGVGLTGCGGSAKSATTVALTSANTKTASGSAVDLTATLSSNNKTTGTVTFYDGTTSIGTSTNLSNGVATLSTTSLSVGTHALTAVYSGDSNNLASGSSSTLEQAVTGTFTLTVNATSGSLSQASTVQASLE
jgi:hypothetical protein